MASTSASSVLFHGLHAEDLDEDERQQQGQRYTLTCTYEEGTSVMRGGAEFR